MLNWCSTFVRDNSGSFQPDFYFSSFIMSNNYDNIALTKIITQIWEHRDITTTKKNKTKGSIAQLFNFP